MFNATDIGTDDCRSFEFSTRTKGHDQGLRFNKEHTKCTLSLGAFLKTSIRQLVVHRYVAKNLDRQVVCSYELNNTRHSGVGVYLTHTIRSTDISLNQNSQTQFQSQIALCFPSTHLWQRTTTLARRRRHCFPRFRKSTISILAI